MLSKIIPMNKDFAKWYTSVIESAKLITYSSIKGMMIFQPNGWSIWTCIQKILDEEFKKNNIKNVQLPLFIKYSEFNKEKEHIKGFSPELFLVTKKGDENLEDPYVIRPTSEVLFCNYFKEITNSYRDLPIKYNQWCNCFRAEKNTRPFLRNCEFFWQELHTIHAYKDEAFEQALDMINIYKNFVENVLCIPTIVGEKTEGEKFAGALNTHTIEAIMQDGQVLQCGTSHYLAQNFSNIYDIKFTNKNNVIEKVYQTSAGVSTRLIGAVIMSHSDDKGLVLPFDLAPVQIAILPILHDKQPEVLKVCQKINSIIKTKYRTFIDQTNASFGYKISEQEISGTPIVISIGPNDLKNNSCSLNIRTFSEKTILDLNLSDSEFNLILQNKIKQYQQNLFSKAKKRFDSSIIEVDSYEKLIKTINDKKVALAPWAGTAEDEIKLKISSSGITPRCIKCPVKNKVCFFTKKPAKFMVYFGRAY